MLRKWLRPALAAVFVIVAVTAISRNTYTSWRSSQLSQLHATCKIALKSEDWTILEQSAREWLELDSHSGFAWIYLGEAAQRRGDFDLTASCLAKLDDDDPKCVPALLELLNLQLAKLNQPLAAMETCRRILRIQPGECTAHQRLIFFAAMTLQFDAMEQQIRHSLRVDCITMEALVYHVGGNELRFSNGYEVTTQWLAAYPGNQLFEVAQALHRARRSGGSESHADKESLLRLCAEKYPENLAIQAYLLDKAIDAGDLDGLGQILSKASAQAEQDSRFWRAKGWFHFTRDELPAAQEAYETALKLNPYDWKSRHQFAAVLRRLGEQDRLEQITDLALEGKNLERTLFELPSASDLPPEIRARLTAYAKQVGDHEFATAAERHFAVEPAL